MNLFGKISLLVRSRLNPKPTYDDVPPDAPTIEYPEVQIDRGRRSAAVNAQTIDEAAAAVNTIGLREKILNHFSDDDLKNLALDMNIDYDDLPGGKGRKVMELMALAQRDGKLTLLVELCQLAKPGVEWTTNQA